MKIFSYIYHWWKITQVCRTHQVFELPGINTLWKHKKTGNVYQVYDYTNLASEKPDKYPIRISYRRLYDGTTWSRRLVDWYDDYEEFKEEFNEEVDMDF